MAEAMVRFHRLAAAEYKSALAWYRVRSQKAASEFRDELGQVIQRRFPYVLYFKIVSPDVITIYALAHARRRLGYWLRRR